MSLVIGSSGDYEYKGGTKVLKTSNALIHRAMVELSLPQGEWLFAPNNGHQLKKYLKDKNLPETRDALKKELTLYLGKYEPEVQDKAISRFTHAVDVEIDEVS